MNTKEMLMSLPEKNRKYLDNLKLDIEKMRETGNWKIANEYENVGKGYIKGLVDCGVIDNFKTAWCWFTV